MNRPFFNYPAGAAGAALLLQRGSACGLLLAVLGSFPSPSPFLVALAYAFVVTLAVGYRTKTAAGSCILVSFCLLGLWPEVPPLLIITHVLDATALVLLGPGAMSLDALRYGRHVVSSSRHEH